MRSTRLSPGTQFAHYLVEARLGEGGVGVVYLARDLALGRKVALKLMSPGLAADPVFRARFATEAEAAAALDHPHVLPLYEAGEEQGQLYLVMRYVPGFDLGTLIARERVLSPQRTRRFLEQLASALDAAHATGLVHRDVKPTNVLIAPGEHAYLADFGLARPAKAERANLTQAGQLVGTVDYLAPELLAGVEASPRSDLYALGCLVVECLSGTPPFRRGNDLATLYAHVNDAVPALTGLEANLRERLDPVIQRVLAKEPDDRYASAGEFAAAVGQALDSEAPLSAPASSRAVSVLRPRADDSQRTGGRVIELFDGLVDKPAGAPRVSRRVLIAGAGALAIVGSVGAAVLRLSTQSAGPPGGKATAPPVILPSHGPLIFELDRTPAGSESVTASFNNPSLDRLRFTGSAVEFTVSPGSWASFSIKDLSPDDFVVDFSVSPLDGEGAIALWFRGNAGHQDQVRLAPSTGELTVQTVASFEATAAPIRLFGPATRVPPSRTEERTLAVTARGREIIVLLAGSEVARVTESVAASGALGVVANAADNRSLAIELRRLRVFGP